MLSRTRAGLASETNGGGTSSSASAPATTMSTGTASQSQQRTADGVAPNVPDSLVLAPAVFATSLFQQSNDLDSKQLEGDVAPHMDHESPRRDCPSPSFEQAD